MPCSSDFLTSYSLPLANVAGTVSVVPQARYPVWLALVRLHLKSILVFTDEDHRVAFKMFIGVMRLARSDPDYG